MASDRTLIAGSEGFGSDAEAEHYFRMSEGSSSEPHSVSVREKAGVPIALRRKRGSRHHEGSRGHASQLPRSKSMSDIALEPIPQESESSMAFDLSRSRHSRQSKAGEVFMEPSARGQVQRRYTHYIPVRLKENEARWQDDLDRWKSRRMSASSDLRRKKEEREQLDLLSNGGEADCLRTAVLRGVQEESVNEGALVFTAYQQLQAKPLEPYSAQEPSSRALPPSQPPALREDPQLDSLTSDKAFLPSESSPITSSCSMPGPMSLTGSTTPAEPLSTPVANSANRAHSSHTNCAFGDDSLLTDQTQMTSTAVFFSPPKSTDTVETLTPAPELNQQDGAPVQPAKSLESVCSGGKRMSATLPRGFRKSEGGSRLSMGVTPRPFGTKSSKVSSLPRFYSMDDSHSSIVKGQRERPQLPASFTVQEDATTLTNKEQAHPSTQTDTSWKMENKVEEEEEEDHSAPKIHSFISASSVASSLKQRAVSESRETQVDYTDMRISLNQKAGSARDFGFEAHWDSTGARIKSIQPGTPAQLCHLQVDDEIVSVGGQPVAEMSYEQWKAKMDAALKEGSLLMDIRRQGQNGHPEHYVAVNSSSSLPAEKVAEAQVNGHSVIGLPVKASNGNSRDIPLVMKNQGGSESAISDLQVPSISASSSCWSWDPEKERRRQEKWQMEQERLLQEKYRRDQERLEEEWRRAQLEAAGEEYCAPEGPPSLSNGNTTSYTPPPFLYQSSSSAFPSQRATEVPVQSRQVTMQIATDQQSKQECDSSSKTGQWSSESFGFAKLTASDRKKSKSTPALDSRNKQDSSTVSVKKKGRQSQAEKERQQILTEMRKKTQLNTDSSWIRQRSACIIYKEPINVAPIRRYDSLDNLPSSTTLSKQFSTMSNPARPHSALANFTPYRGYSGRCSLSPGAAIFSTASKQNSWSRTSSTSSTPPVTPGTEEPRTSSQQHDRYEPSMTGINSRLVSGRRTCSRCEHPLGKGAAMVIDSLDLCFHIVCFKCVSCRTDLSRGSKSRAQVRVRHRQLFCDTCYSRLRVRQGIPK